MLDVFFYVSIYIFYHSYHVTQYTPTRSVIYYFLWQISKWSQFHLSGHHIAYDCCTFFTISIMRLLIIFITLCERNTIIAQDSMFYISKVPFSWLLLQINTLSYISILYIACSFVSFQFEWIRDFMRINVNISLIKQELFLNVYSILFFVFQAWKKFGKFLRLFVVSCLTHLSDGAQLHMLTSLHMYYILLLHEEIINLTYVCVVRPLKIVRILCWPHKKWIQKRKKWENREQRIDSDIFFGLKLTHSRAVYPLVKTLTNWND